MSSLQDLIKKIQVEKATSESYVYYSKDTGKIHKISSTESPDENYEVIKLLNKDVNSILTGKNKTEDFLIYFNIKTKQIELKKVKNNNKLLVSETMAYKLPVELDFDNNNYDAVIKQNLIKNVWELVLNPETKNFLINNGYNLNEIIYFSITSKNDPNIFYRSIKFNLEDVIESNAVVAFKYDIENSTDDIGVYTAKYFNNYAHGVVHDKI
jgi:hypothetical protein